MMTPYSSAHPPHPTISCRNPSLPLCFSTMNLAPDTATVEAQRNTELLLLDYLRSTNPHLYALWGRHPDKDAVANDESESDGDDTGSRSSVQSSGSAAAASPPPSGYVYAQPQLHRAAHADFLLHNLESAPSGMAALYSARPWIVYWALQAADMLGVLESDVLARVPASDIVAFLHSCLCVDRMCQAEVGFTAAAEARADDAAPEAAATAPPHRPVMGFAGGAIHQEPHVAASYAAVCALVILSGHDGGASLRRLPRAAIKRWLLTLRNDDGGFRVHGGGESDIRASYCAAVMTTLLGLDDPLTFADGAACGLRGGTREYVDDVRDVPVLTLQTARYVAACQTHEGGFTCAPSAAEAHGAYTQCGLASLLLMKQPHLVHQAPLRRWLAARQLSCEGGFNGRTNKLVDSCYSHWIGASHVLLRTVEAFTKCFSGGCDSADGGPAAQRCLRAREVFLLDLSQLLDAASLQASADAAWDAAEAAQSAREDITEAFLSADDSVRRAATSKVSSQAALYEAVLEQEMRDTHTAASASTEEVENGVATELAAWRARQAFLLADVGDLYFNQRKLQDYVLRCCQDAEIGGLMDKPGTAHDGYHTCYSLSGMSAAQNLQYLNHAAVAFETRSGSDAPTYLGRAFARGYVPSRQSLTAVKAGGSFGVVLDVPGASPAAESMVLRPTNPVFNLHPSRVLSSLRVWGTRTFV